jgi:hypothetical protein
MIVEFLLTNSTQQFVVEIICVAELSGSYSAAVIVLLQAL